MKKFFAVGYKWLLGSLLTTLMLLMLISPADISFAHPPRQAGDQPDFSLSLEIAPDGGAMIESQETTLDPAYFTANGSLDGTRVTSTGLTLAEGQTVGSYLSHVIFSPLSFTTDIVPLWRADLPGGTGLRLETRLSFDGSTWSDWLENPEAFYPVRDDLHAGHLIWVGGDQAALQVRVTLLATEPEVVPTLNSLTLVFNDTSHGPTDGQIAGQMADQVRSAAINEICPIQEKPPVVLRTAWGCPDGQKSPRRPPVYQPVTHIILHQTETPNHTRPYQDWAGWVRSVWNYHARVLWWGDVGYNYLIDPNGVIYEGRAGGDDVVGIHDTHNAGSMAIGFLGCYGACDDPRLSVAEPSEAMLESAARLIAWKLNKNGIDPHSSGPYGHRPDVPVIAGGRDVTQTTSPGDHLYSRLPELRDAVQAKIKACEPPPLAQCRISEVTFDRDGYTVGEPINLTATVVDGQGNPLNGASVRANVAAPDGSSGSIELAGEGTYQGSYTNTGLPGDYRFILRAEDPTGQIFTACTSDEQIVPVSEVALPACTLTAQAEPATLPAPGGTVTLSAMVSLNASPINEANVTAQVTKPDNSGAVELSLPSQGNGIYALPFDDTSTPGDYAFSVTANGQDFTSCQAGSSFTVAAQTGGPIVIIEPASLSLCQAGPGATSQIRVSGVTGLQGIAFKLNFDPNLISVVDADPGTPDVVEIRAGETVSGKVLFEVENQVVDGLIGFAVVLNSPISGEAILVEIDWKPVAAGSSALTLDSVDLADPNGSAIPSQVLDGSVEVSPCGSAGVIGRVLLQGRQDHSGVLVSDGQTQQQAQTNAEGFFTVAGADLLHLKMPGYLAAQIDVRAGLGQASAAAPFDLGTITLLAGDVNDDNLVNILDLARLGARYNSDDQTADINADGLVDILDLVLAANNYGRQGPLIWQQHQLASN